MKLTEHYLRKLIKECLLEQKQTSLYGLEKKKKELLKSIDTLARNNYQYELKGAEKELENVKKQINKLKNKKEKQDKFSKLMGLLNKYEELAGNEKIKNGASPKFISYKQIVDTLRIKLNGLMNPF